MAMFNNYKNIPDSYVPNNINPPPYYNPTVKFPLEEYDLRGNLIGFSWKYMDTILLDFLTTGSVLYDSGEAEDADVYLENKKFRLVIYNFRYEEIYSEEMASSASFKYIIGDDLRVLLKPGTYSMSVTLIDEDDNIEQTLLDANILKIFIK